MSGFAYDQASEILKNPNRWELDIDIFKYVIYGDDERFYIAELRQDGEKWYITDGVQNSLWFKTYASASKYMRDEMYVQGRFKKVKST